MLPAASTGEGSRRTTEGPEPSSSLLQPFYPALDGLRALAFLSVFAFHYGLAAHWGSWKARCVEWGWVGVDAFFVLSGFLITGILFDSLHQRHFFRNFYIRRALRIFPLYYGFWLLVLALTPVLHVSWNRYMVSMLFYLGNFFMPGSRMGLHPHPALILFQNPFHPARQAIIYGDHLWSLCVEEQFYLLWPALLWLVRSRRALLRICLGMLFVLPFARFLFADIWPASLGSLSIYQNTFFHSDGLLAGAAIALWLRGPAVSRTLARQWAWALTLAPPVLLAYALWATPGSLFSPADPVVNVIGFGLLAATGCGLLLLSIDLNTTFARALQITPLAYLGRLSYGAYFFHEMVMTLLGGPKAQLPRVVLAGLPIPNTLLVLGTTIGLAWLSFRFFESQFLRLKPLLAPRPGAVDDPPVHLSDPCPEDLAPAIASGDANPYHRNR